LYSSEVTRRIELVAKSALPPHTLMRRAGVAVARLGLAIAPHSRRVWIACGPGNNGGDGFEAAQHLQRSGKSVVVTWLGSNDKAPPDAAASYQRAMAAGVCISETPPTDCDLCVDAILGIGSSRAPEGRMAEWIRLMNVGSATILAVDAPTGLQADTGGIAQHHIKADHTLSLLTLKAGLFTACGRDVAGTVWLDDLDVFPADFPDHREMAPSAWLAGVPDLATRLHASHKGSYGDVAVVGGARGMTGAALLAASAALNAGAGRVYVGLIDDDTMSVDPNQPELMFRSLEAIDFKSATVVCGCGGGEAIGEPLARILSTAAQLVIDADALNRIASDTKLRTLLQARTKRRAATVLTPHPLEAARLLESTVGEIQANRIASAQRMAERFDCTVVLKGSGTITAAPDQIPVINSTGNARLATAGTGDVLAGMIGARLAAHVSPFQAAWESVYQHGLKADDWPNTKPLTAGSLSKLL
jgi:hydroxyethylthiazole kinase-like uncharacterized protein yjeF